MMKSAGNGMGDSDWTVEEVVGVSRQNAAKVTEDVSRV